MRGSVAIVGAGISGCKLAELLSKSKDINLTVFESRTLEEIGNTLCSALVSPRCIREYNLSEYVTRTFHTAEVSYKGIIRSVSVKGFDLVRFNRFLWERDQHEALKSSVDIRYGETVDIESIRGEFDLVIDCTGRYKDYESFGTCSVVEDKSIDKPFITLEKNLGWIVPLTKPFIEVGYISNIVNPENSRAYRPIPNSLRPSLVNGNIVYVGASAGFVKPHTGGGIYYALVSSNALSNFILYSNTLESCGRLYSNLMRKSIIKQVKFSRTFIYPIMQRGGWPLNLGIKILSKYGDKIDIDAFDYPSKLLRSWI